MARLHIAAALLLACAAAAAASALPSIVVRHNGEDHGEETKAPSTTGNGTVAVVTTVAATTTDAGATTVAGGATTVAAAAGVTTVPGATTVAGATTVPGTTVIDDKADPTAEATEEGDADGTCFPADATVELQSGEIVPMHSLSVGDSVKVGAGEYSTVFMFTHKLHDIAYDYVTLRTASGVTLSLTSGHYLYSNGALVAAGSVVEGDVLTLGEGGSSAVVEVGTRAGHGLFNPQTLHGDVVVNGIVSSTYTTAVAPGFAHAVLAPIRALSGVGLRFTGLESGAQTFVGVVPGANMEQ